MRIRDCFTLLDDRNSRLLISIFLRRMVFGKPNLFSSSLTVCNLAQVPGVEAQVAGVEAAPATYELVWARCAVDAR